MRYQVVRWQTAALVLVVVLLLLVVLVRGAGTAVQTAATPKKHPIYSVETDRPLVSLGINCAWDNADIPQLIAVLEEYDIKATFFVVGDWCERYPESVKALYDAGHEIGSHSDTHADMTKLDQDGILREIRDSAARIQAVTGERPTLFRPPSGAYNTLVVELIEQEGMYPIQWNCDSVDYREPSADEMQQRIFKTLRNGSILLFHSGAANTPAALPQIIEAIRAEGYDFVPISQLIHPYPYTVDFEGRQHPADPS